MSADETGWHWFGTIVFAIIIALIVGFGSYMNGYVRGQNAILLDAVRHQAAHWVTDQDGSAHIEWRQK